MCCSFGGKGWHDDLQKFEDQTKEGVGGSEAYYAQESDRLEDVSVEIGSAVLDKE